MKATLEFDLPDDQHAFNLATKAAEMHSLILECHAGIRSYLKYNNPEVESPLDILEDIKFRLSVVLDYE
jgi:hypothetical protein